jgi:hypothetical protein
MFINLENAFCDVSVVVTILAVQHAETCEAKTRKIKFVHAGYAVLLNAPQN